MEDIKPTVLFLFVSEAAMYEPDTNLDALETALEPRAHVLRTNEAAPLLPSIPLLRPRAVVLVDPQTTENDDLDLWAQLRVYIWEGGTVIIAGWKWEKPLDVHSNSLFGGIFFLPWRFGESVTEPVKVEMTPDFSSKRNLKLTHSGGRDVLPVLEHQAQGRQLKNVDEHEKVYVAGQGSAECMSCIRLYSSGGSVAYIGDTEMNEATKRTYKWLIGMT